LPRPRVAVLGVGGVGGYFGGRLAQTQEADVVFLARGRHLDALRSRGLQVRSLLGDFHIEVEVTDDTAFVGPVDFVLVCVKTYDNDTAIASLHPLVGSNTAVVSLQNGIENEGLIANAIGPKHVLGGAAFIFSRITEPGVVAHTGGPARIVFGELDGRSSTRAERLLTLFEAAGVDTVLSDDIRGFVWDKFAFICAQAGMTATSRLPIGDIRAVSETWDAFLAILDEVAEVAAAEGVVLEGVRDRHGAFARGLEAGSYSSLYDDMLNGRPMELEALHGALVRLADRHDIAVPVSRTVYAVLKPWSLKNLRDTE
jgi:2-dehydropantoate 2-reductase